MTDIPPVPGWYPDPADPSRNLYWDGNAWHRNGAPPPEPPPQQVIKVRKSKRHPILWFIVLVIGLAWISSQCSKSDNQTARSGDTGTSAKDSGTRPSSTQAPATPAPAPSPESQPDSWEYMAGNGTHQMGGVDGKNWGVWESDGTTGVSPGRNCTWSIRSVAAYRGGIVLDQGEAPPGEKVRVLIDPDGDVSTFDGTIGDDNHRIVFMTNNCGAWTAT